jgi:hypothetical protein
MHGLDRLFHKVADEHTLAVGYRAERRYEPRCAHAAEAASRLGKQDLGAQAGGTEAAGGTGIGSTQSLPDLA